ncbi:MAG TPA: S41 family peptidase [Verrucomicrobiae bacterium]|nr:S41 family peptidase [Verrucomicrobiae bacterium]
MNAGNDDKSFGPPRRKLRPGFQWAFVLVFGMGLGLLLDRWMLMTFLPSDALSDFRLMSEAWNTIERFYVDRAAVKPEALTYGAISGMVNALGDTGHSVFLTPGMVKELHVMESGKLKGVGLEVQMKNAQVVIVAPMDNSPALRSGLRSGDIIVSVDGRDIAGMPLDQVVEEISGPPGTSVELGTLNPKTHRLRSVTIVRATINISDVTWARLPGTDVADVRIASFEDNMADDLRADLREIHRQQMRGLILDLRGNPGGVLDEAVQVASQFLTHGNVLLVKDAKGKITAIPVLPGGLATNIPMAVLIDYGTASAAEIVAGALRDAHRGELIGETTFGTGTVLNEFPLPGGSAILLAVEEWLTPDGQSFWHKGISPQITVALPPDANALFPKDMGGMTAHDLESSQDKQLLRGLEWVTQQTNQ